MKERDEESYLHEAELPQALIVAEKMTENESSIAEAIRRLRETRSSRSGEMDEAPLYGYSPRSSMNDLLNRWEGEAVKSPKELLRPALLTISSNVEDGYVPKERVPVTLLNDRGGTAVGEKPVTAVEESGEKEHEPRVESSVMAGLNSYIDQSRLSWEYLLKSGQKALTTDEAKKEALQREIDDIVDEYSSLPTLEGAANISSIGANIVSSALPVAAAGVLLSPVAAASIGGGVIVADVGKSVANANIEMDEYEKITGNEIPEGKRAGYIVASVATDMIMNVMLNSNMFKSVSKSVVDKVRKGLKKEIIANPIAQEEFNTMTRHVLKRERARAGSELAKDVVGSSVEGALAGGAMEAEKGIYRDEMPEMESIINSVIGGAMGGAVMGSVDGSMNSLYKHKDRMNRDIIHYGSNTSNKEKGKLPITEVVPVKIEPKSARTAKKGNMTVEYTPDHAIADRVARMNDSHVVSGSYRKAHDAGATVDKSDHWDFSPEQRAYYGDKWKEAKRLSKQDVEESYAIQNEVVQNIAAEMGVPVRVYATKNDVPKEYRGSEEIANSSAVTVGNDEIWVILDHCKNMDVDEVIATVRHEAVGHYGMRKNYASDERYDEALARIGRDVKVDKEEVEELASKVAEYRDYTSLSKKQYKGNMLPQELRRSEDNLRNTTIGELREGYINKLRKRVGSNENPMPSLYEIERGKRYRNRKGTPYK